MIYRLNPSLILSPEVSRKISRFLRPVRRYAGGASACTFSVLPRKQSALASLLPAAPLLPLLQQDTTSSSGAAAQLPRCLRALRGMRRGLELRLCEPIAAQGRDACRGVPGDKNLTGWTAFSSRSTRSATTLPAKASRDSGRSPSRGAGLKLDLDLAENHYPHRIGRGGSQYATTLIHPFSHPVHDHLFRVPSPSPSSASEVNCV